MAAEDIISTKAIHPGALLLGELKTRKITQKEFATLIGLQASHLNEIIKGKRNINEEIAKKIELVLGTPYSMWLNFQGWGLTSELRVTPPYSMVLRHSPEQMLLPLISELEPHLLSPHVLQMIFLSSLISRIYREAMRSLTKSFADSELS